ncbi:MAG TPA: KTSC domain-containing protein [Thermoanaerobaculia bacterium]|nr:KTSC domain-containing protein [Thermoanaerobaculia bacterium]
MRRQPVESSVIRTVGHDEGNNILEVEFRNGRIYHYYRVPLTAYEALIQAPSAGNYFNTEIRKRYRGARVRPG